MKITNTEKFCSVLWLGYRKINKQSKEKKINKKITQKIIFLLLACCDSQWSGSTRSISTSCVCRPAKSFEFRVQKDAKGCHLTHSATSLQVKCRPFFEAASATCKERVRFRLLSLARSPSTTVAGSFSSPPPQHCHKSQEFPTLCRRCIVGAAPHCWSRQDGSAARWLRPPQQCASARRVRRRIFYLAVGHVLSRSQAAGVPNGAISLLGCFLHWTHSPALFCRHRVRQLNGNYPHWQLTLRQIENGIRTKKRLHCFFKHAQKTNCLTSI